MTVQVLYVERDLEFARRTAEQVEQINAKIQVTTVLGLESALQALSNDRYDCIVSEYKLPDGTGLELFEHTQSTHPTLPFILFTEHGDESVASDAVTAGISDYLQKAESNEPYELLADSISNVVATDETVTEATRERRRLEQVLKTVPSCVVQVNRDGQFIFANNRAETVLGLEQKNSKGVRITIPSGISETSTGIQSLIPNYRLTVFCTMVNRCGTGIQSDGPMGRSARSL